LYTKEEEAKNGETAAEPATQRGKQK